MGLGVLLQKRGVPTGYLEAQSLERTRNGGRRGAGLPFSDLAVGQHLLQFGDAGVGDFVWWR